MLTPIESPIKLCHLSGCHSLSRGECILPTPYLRRCLQKIRVNTKTRCQERCFLGSFSKFTKRKQHLTTSRMPPILHRYSYRLHKVQILRKNLKDSRIHQTRIKGFQWGRLLYLSGSMTISWSSMAWRMLQRENSFSLSARASHTDNNYTE